MEVGRFSIHLFRRQVPGKGNAPAEVKVCSGSPATFGDPRREDVIAGVRSGGGRGSMLQEVLAPTPDAGHPMSFPAPSAARFLRSGPAWLANLSHPTWDEEQGPEE